MSTRLRLLFVLLPVLLLALLLVLLPRPRPAPRYGLDFTLSYPASGGRVVRGARAGPDHAPAPPSLCGAPVPLPALEMRDSVSSALFLVETSGRSSLLPRQACAVESAARQSGLQVHLILTAPSLDLGDNTTCQVQAQPPCSLHCTLSAAPLPTGAPGPVLHCERHPAGGRYPTRGVSVVTWCRPPPLCRASSPPPAWPAPATPPSTPQTPSGCS